MPSGLNQFKIQLYEAFIMWDSPCPKELTILIALSESKKSGFAFLYQTIHEGANYCQDNYSFMMWKILSIGNQISYPAKHPSEDGDYF